MRSSSYCESYCAPPLCYFPCLPKSKDDAGGGDPKSGSPSPAAVAEDKPPVVQKIEESAPAAAAAATGGVDGVGDDDKFYREVAVAPKSCLKRANCEDSSKIAAKGNVKWRDLLGKDLTQVKEFEPREISLRFSSMDLPQPSESGDSDDEEYTGACTCIIQ